MRGSLIYILVLSCAGCTSAQIQSYNQTLKDWKFSLNNPDDPALVKQVYFTLMPNPYAIGYPVEALGSWTFDTFQFSTGAGSINSDRTPAQEKEHNICNPTNNREGQ